MVQSAPLVVVNHLGEALGSALSAHPCKPIVETASTPDRPWAIREDANILITGTLPGWRDAPEQAPSELSNLGWIQTISAGVDIFPRWLLSGRLVSTGRGLTASLVAEYVMAAILRMQKPLELTAVRGNIWNSTPLGAVAGQRLGIAGFGAIGAEILQRARAFEMDVSILRREPPAEAPAGARYCSDIEELIGWADHLVLALPSTAESRNMLNRSRLLSARTGLHLINISRGDLLDQEGLIAAIDAGRIRCATLDVTDPEPLPIGHPMLTHPKILITPHNAWTGGDWKAAFTARVLRGLDAYANGDKPDFQVDVERGY
ncbi:NAD(P)-dependent oxidoreductase [Rhizobium sp. BR 315]|uniref:NAD(P)-dependent oxidoreductase n=1 Tax=Rhizobium sp. BR 315 TaxID=3040014 RepID=UPI003D33FC6F